MGEIKEEREKRALEIEKNTAQQRVAELKAQEARIEAEKAYSDTVGMLSSLKSQAQEINGEIASKRQELFQVNEDLLKKREISASMDTTINTARVQLASDKQKLDFETKSSRERLSSVEAYQVKRDAELKDKEVALLKEKERLDNYSLKLKSEQDGLDAYRVELNEKAKDMLNLNKEIEANKAAEAKLLEDIARAKSEVNLARQDLNDREMLFKKQEASVEERKKELDEKELELNAFNVELLGRKAKIDNLIKVHNLKV